MKRRKVMVILGTRPEAIKLCPVIRQLQYYVHDIETHVVVTGQHRSMLDQILKFFGVTPDYDLDIMQDDQSLTDIIIRSLRGLESILQKNDYQLVMVQGDTSTAFVGALSAYYHKIPVAHVEAGLRTRNKFSPYPEEINRHFIDVLADLCFAPTMSSKNELLKEGTDPECILVTGNTVIDALLTTVNSHYEFMSEILKIIKFRPACHTLLATVHRRENHGQPLYEICQALKHLISTRDDLQLVLPVHPNPNVYQEVHNILGDLDNTYLTEPLEYPDFVNLMARAHIILTDSGGVQEEAPSLGKPVLVLRDTTERQESISAGTARLIGTQREVIISAVNQLLDDPNQYEHMSQSINPYGDGRAAERIVQAIRYNFNLTNRKVDEFSSDNVWHGQAELTPLVR